ncbi:MAG TPA: SWIM zinc finger family protein [Pyrinomonadaceae bacterium]|nr:SWIM zinc finger family protein [Pyrinomonadaceae bacterium]
MVNNFKLEIKSNNESFTFDSEMLCLTDRKQEFKQASDRASKSDLCVFCDAPDRYVVVNIEARANYGVKLRTAEGRIYADCDCGDFVFRQRVCKHIAAVIDEILFG